MKKEYKTKVWYENKKRTSKKSVVQSLREERPEISSEELEAILLRIDGGEKYKSAAGKLYEARETSNRQDLKRIAERDREKYDRLTILLDREAGEAFRQRLSENDLSFADWARGAVEDYMKKTQK